MLSTEFNPESFQGAIERILNASGYETESHVKVNGAEVDIIARRRGAAIPETLCIECTIEKVGVEKYGKDLTKFALLRESDPSIACIIVSLNGFAGPTKERATNTRIHCWTYVEFRQKFLLTAAYENLVLGPALNSPIRLAPAEPDLPKQLWQDIEDLEAVYQVPTMVSGTDFYTALPWFDQWLNREDKTWVSLIGDYGTGKTALTKMLLARWMRRWQREGRYLPIRIELKDFATKFDFEGLMIHFWKSHRLDDMPLRGLEMLINEGRAVFILDGYDEMAQNLSLMDRRNCLVAIAKAVSGASCGIITSRPNYFTEAEELYVVELLYRHSSRGLHRLDEIAAVDESVVDGFMDRYYNDRKEVRLRDLEREQVQDLITKRLENKPKVLQTVKRITESIYSLAENDAQKALATKPVIITYLLEVAENLDGVKLEPYRPLNDWGIYKLLLDRLIFRDQRRTSGIVAPSERRLFLQKLAWELGANGKTAAGKDDIISHVHKMFGRQIRRHGDYEAAAQEEIYFADLRSSASLTSDSKTETWFFSHSSLREFLSAEIFVEIIVGESLQSPEEQVSILREAKRMPLSQGFIRFICASLDHYSEFDQLMSRYLASYADSLLSLMVAVWSRIAPGKLVERLESVIPGRVVAGAVLSDAVLSKLEFRGWTFRDAFFDRVTMDDVSFVDCSFEECGFYDSVWASLRLSGCKMAGCDISGISLKSLRCKDSVLTSTTVDKVETRGSLLTGLDAAAFFRYSGATIMEQEHLNVLQFHARWSDFLKVIEQLDDEVGWRQELGLIKKGGIKDTRWVQRLVDTLVNNGYCERQKRRNTMVKLTSSGRRLIDDMIGGKPPATVNRLF